MASLHHVFLVNHHVVTKIIEAELVIRAVGDISGVSLALFIVILAVNYKSRSKSEEAVNTAHFLTVTGSEVVVDRNYMNALFGKRVKICGQGCNEGFTFTRFHLRNSSLMKKNTAHKLNSVRTLAENSLIRLANEGERLGQNIVKSRAVAERCLEFIRISAHFLVAHLAEGIRECFYLINDRNYFLYLFFAVAFKKTHCIKPLESIICFIA